MVKIHFGKDVEEIKKLISNEIKQNISIWNYESRYVAYGTWRISYNCEIFYYDEDNDLTSDEFKISIVHNNEEIHKDCISSDNYGLDFLELNIYDAIRQIKNEIEKIIERTIWE